jgi:uncharacterized YigZ family protein
VYVVGVTDASSPHGPERRPDDLSLRQAARHRIGHERCFLTSSLKTVASPYQCETRVRGSRFIASIWPVSDVRQVKQRLSDLQREYNDARHHCWSYRIAAEPGDLERSSDAGEPAGTAGAPIRQAIHAADLADVLVVVIRYFGGTKLGRGGLVRAYREATRGAIRGSRPKALVRSTRLRLCGPLGGDGGARHLIARHGGTVVRAAYEDRDAVVLEVTLPAEAAESLIEDLGDLTRGGWGPSGEKGRSAPRGGGETG